MRIVDFFKSLGSIASMTILVVVVVVVVVGRCRRRRNLIWVVF